MLPDKIFLSDWHKENYNKLMARFGGYEDRERMPLFYIIASRGRFMDDIDVIYDFKKNIVNPAILEGPYSSGEMAMLRLGIHLYNDEHEATVFGTFYNLDHDNATVALRAIQIRFRI